MEFLVKAFLPQVIHGLVIGSTLALICIGLSLVFGVMKVVNFAHGELFMIGSFCCYYILLLIPNFWIATLGALIITGVLSAVIERLTIRPILKRSEMYGLLITFGVGVILMEFVRLIWGAAPRHIFGPFSGSISFLGVVYPEYRLFVLLITAPLIVGMWFLLHKTQFGSIIRATSQDSDMAMILGVDIRNIYSITFILGGILAALGGCILAPITAVYHTLGTDIILRAFAVVIIGGMGSFKGTITAALIIGELESLSYLLIPYTFIRIMIFAFMAGILVIRPSGLFSTQETKK